MSTASNAERLAAYLSARDNFIDSGMGATWRDHEYIIKVINPNDGTMVELGIEHGEVSRGTMDTLPEGAYIVEHDGSLPFTVSGIGSPVDGMIVLLDELNDVEDARDIINDPGHITEYELDIAKALVAEHEKIRDLVAQINATGTVHVV